jgi:sugar phosphate isomerase/epimerase
MDRRGFLRKTGLAAASMSALPAARIAVSGASEKKEGADMKFRISLAAWSVHQAFFQNGMKMIEQPAFCKEVGIHGLELVNTFFPSPQYGYLQEFMRAAEDNEVKILLIMCDNEGDMAHTDRNERMLAAKNHHKWVDIAQVLGCHSIRCNSGSGKPGETEAVKRAAESFSELAGYAAQAGLNVIIENHGGLSSHPDELVSLFNMVDKPNFGALPDFGNFPEEVDRYEAVRKMMPFAKAVSAKCHDFGPDGNETETDYAKMMKIVLDAGYSGWVGIEYEGARLSEKEGVLACKKLLERFQ